MPTAKERSAEYCIRWKQRAQANGRRVRKIGLLWDYNLTGNVSGICPECGTSIPEEQRRAIAEAAKAMASEVGKTDPDGGSGGRLIESTNAPSAPPQ